MTENMHKYAKTWSVLVKYAKEMDGICPKYACKYADSTQLYSSNMLVYANNMEKKMQKICNYINCISGICKKYAGKYAEISKFICKICKRLYIAYIAFIS